MSIDDLYNNFKIVKQEGKGTVCSNLSSQNMAFVSSPSPISTNEVPTIYGVSTASTQSSTANTKAMVAIDGVGFDWSYMAEDEVPTIMALMVFLDSGVYTNNTCSKTCLKSYETLEKQYDDLRVEFNTSEFNLVTYKTGLASVEEQLVFYKKNEVIFCEQIDVLKRDLSYRDSEISGLKRELENLKKEKEKEFKQPEFQNYGPKSSKTESENASKEIPNELKEYPDAPLFKDKIEFVKAKQQEKPVRKPVKYAEMYRSQGPRENQRNWNNLKSQQLAILAPSQSALSHILTLTPFIIPKD
nr:hypothetical protein [Tanacetum cinerariifolium]